MLSAAVGEVLSRPRKTSWKLADDEHHQNYRDCPGAQTQDMVVVSATVDELHNNRTM